MIIKVRMTKDVNTKRYGDSTVSFDIEKYTAISSATEMGGASVEAHKAQAIAVRTNAYYYAKRGKSISDSSPQAFNIERDSARYKNARQGAEATRGLVLYYNGKIAYPASFSANNGGKTVSSKERWGSYRAWLKGGKTDPWDYGRKIGHGLGLSQRSTSKQVAAGRSFEDILSFYYDGTYLHNIYTGEDFPLTK